MPSLLASLVNLNHLGSYIHWHWIQISVANLVVIGVMLVLFVLAILLPFPGSKHASSPAAEPTEAPAPSTSAEVHAP